MSPEDMGGVPAVMPSNDWWKTVTDLGGRVLDTYQNIQLAKVQSGVAAPAGRVASNPKNYPPGGMGANPQAASVAGGVPLPFSWQSLTGAVGGGGLIVAAIGVLVLVLVLRR